MKLGRVAHYVIALVVAGLVPGLSGSAAFAQDEPANMPASRLKTPFVEANTDRARKYMKDFAKCVYRRKPERSEKLLRYSDNASINYSAVGFERDEIETKLSLSSCAGDVMDGRQESVVVRISPLSLRNHLAEEAYLSHNASALVIAESDDEVLSNRYETLTATDKTRFRAAFADCVVYHAVREADALIRTSVATDEERQAVKALVPALSQCLTDGQEMELTVKTIRGLAADGLWSRTQDRLK